jgi:hypothetical protein
MDTLNTLVAGGARRFAFGLLGLVLLGLSACAIREGDSDPTGGSGGSGVVISVTDSSKVTLDFNNLDTLVFRDSGEFDLDKMREKLDEKEIDLESIKIIGLVVTYNDSTRQFLTDNEGIKFILRIYVKEVSDTAKAKLTLESYVDPAKASTLDPDHVLFDLFARRIGFVIGSDMFRSV